LAIVRLGVGGQRIGAIGGHDHRPPQPPGDDDRDPDRGRDADGAHGVDDLPGHPLVVVDARRPAALADHRHHARAVQHPAGPHFEHRATLGIVGALRRRPVRLEAHDADDRHGQDGADLLGHDREELELGGSLRHERRHPAQRGLLLGKATVSTHPSA
jgi:hypothetical protein